MRRRWPFRRKKKNGKPKKKERKEKPKTKKKKSGRGFSWDGTVYAKHPFRV